MVLSKFPGMMQQFELQADRGIGRAVVCGPPGRLTSACRAFARFVDRVRSNRLQIVVVLGLALGATTGLPADADNNGAAANPAFVPRPPAPRRPNIILIVADGLGYGDLGCYGQSLIQTTNLDRLAAEGMRFTDFYAGAAEGAPAQCSLMTGLDTGHARIRGNGTQALRPDDLTVGEFLKKVGYRTGLIGEWDLGGQNSPGMPGAKGFDQFLGYLDRTHAEDYFTDHLWRTDLRLGHNTWEIFAENESGRHTLYVPDLFTKAGVNFIHINKPEQFNHHRPFFLCLAYSIPRANTAEAKRTGNGMQVPDDAPYSAQPWPQPEKNKAAMITQLDGDVGKLLAKLQELKIDEDTAVLFTSRSGPQRQGGADPKFFKSSGPWRGLAGDLYEGGIRVPLIVRWPAKVKPGRVNNEPWAAWDLFPTAAGIALSSAPQNLDGISMLPTLLGRAQARQHEFFYWESHEGGFRQAVRWGPWKAVRLQPGLAPELYNLQSDPGEKSNVAAEHPEIVTKIEAYFRSGRTDSAGWPVRPREQKTAQELPAGGKPS